MRLMRKLSVRVQAVSIRYRRPETDLGETFEKSVRENVLVLYKQHNVCYNAEYRYSGKLF